VTESRKKVESTQNMHEGKQEFNAEFWAENLKGTLKNRSEDNVVIDAREEGCKNVN
jgi:hypothetical protein